MCQNLNRVLTHLSLFSGIGGLDLSAEMAGFKTVGQCELEDFQTQVLEKHWPHVPRWRDIRTLTGDNFYLKTGLRTVDVISGGFPCQPFSVAGKRTGESDNRFLWPEMLRVIREIAPAWVIGENVYGIINLALDQVLSDLEDEGYAVQAFVIPACGVDAPHRRERVAIVANAIDGSSIMRRHRELAATQRVSEIWKTHSGRSKGAQQWLRREHRPCISGVAHGLRKGIYKASADTRSINTQGSVTCEVLGRGSLPLLPSRTCRAHSAWQAWPSESGIPRVADGVPNRMDRIKSLGNAVVPQQFYIFFHLIYIIESEKAEV